MTTIKVPSELRDRINAGARARGLTAAGLIEGLLDGLDRGQRMREFGRAMNSAGQDYRDEMAAWDLPLAGDVDDS